MKYQRQAKIMELVKKYDIETQDELLERLEAEGYKSTQGTVSRDIREMNLTKVATLSGGQKYAIRNMEHHELPESYRKVLNAGIISIDTAENIIVIKTVSGMAMAVAAALDNMEITGLVGTIAGDDTVFVAVKSNVLTMSVKADIENVVS